MVQRIYETRLVCPAEVTLPIPQEARPAADAVVRTNEAGDAYLAAKDGREDLLAARMSAAQVECLEGQAR